jgi:hypothetical protein
MLKVAWRLFRGPALQAFQAIDGETLKFPRLKEKLLQWYGSQVSHSRRHPDESFEAAYNEKGVSYDLCIKT